MKRSLLACVMPWEQNVETLTEKPKCVIMLSYGCHMTCMCHIGDVQMQHCYVIREHHRARDMQVYNMDGNALGMCQRSNARLVEERERERECV